MVSLNESLTNEQLTKRFPNPFLLVNRAIELARQKIEEEDGSETNPANEVLEWVALGKELPSEDELEAHDQE